MPQRVNYRQERSSRARTKQAKQMEKLQKKNEQAAERKALRDRAETTVASPEEADAEEGQ